MITFEDIQTMHVKTNVYLINIMSATEQSCLIQGTVSIEDEVATMNRLIEQGKTFDCTIYLYGKNSHDVNELEHKRNKMKKNGFMDVYIYPGGLFEWLLLQDIYGSELFPTTSTVLDILQYRPKKNQTKKIEQHKTFWNIMTSNIID